MCAHREHHKAALFICAERDEVQSLQEKGKAGQWAWQQPHQTLRPLLSLPAAPCVANKCQVTPNPSQVSLPGKHPRPDPIALPHKSKANGDHTGISALLSHYWTFWLGYLMMQNETDLQVFLMHYSLISNHLSGQAFINHVSINSVYSCLNMGVSWVHVLAMNKVYICTGGGNITRKY